MPKCSQERQAYTSGSLYLRSVCSLLLLLGGAIVTTASAQSTRDPLIDQHFIIGGEPVFENTSAPWIVALSYRTDAELVQRQFCGGSIIADQWVMTAAHCLYDRRGDLLELGNLTVAINAADLRDAGATELAVTNMIVHPEYEHNANNPHSDIALLELATSSGIEPVALSTKPTDELVGLDAIVLGWGAVDLQDPAKPQFPVQLHKVDVPIVSLAVCNSPISYGGALYPNQLCAGLPEGGRDSCVGDSGGPMVVNVEGQTQQAGIVSFGFGCALANFYGVYTDVPYFIGWINQYVYVGDPEFEPELLAARTTPVVSGPLPSNSDVASMNWFLLVLVGLGFIRRRSA